MVCTVALVAWWALVACGESQPPLLGDCTEKQCAPPIIVSGGTLGDAGCGLGSPNATCNDCLDVSCCQPDITCANSATCVALVSCINGCATNDPICFNDCVGANEGGVSTYDALATCVTNACNIACAQTD